MDGLKVAYIHGAKSTRRSFNYLVELLPEHEPVFVEYLSSTPLEQNIKTVTKRLLKEEPDAIIGHSLGGVIGAFAKLKMPHTRMVAIASPFGGVFMANFLRFQGQMYKDVGSWNPLFHQLHVSEFDASMLALVATGSEAETPATDGVVPVASQTALVGCLYEEVALNHFEVLMDEDVAKIIESHIFN